MPAAEPRLDPDGVARLAEVPAKLATLLESERWPGERLRRWQLDHLDELLESARAIPAWAERLGAEDRADGLEALPILERDELQARDTELAAADLGPVIEWRTSGTSGRPVRVLHGPDVAGYNAAARLRQQTRFGLPAAPLAEAGFEVKVGPSAPPVRAVGERPPKFLLSHLALDEHTLEDVHRTLLAAGGVRLIGAWPSMVEPWARLYEQSDLDGGELGVRLCALGAEVASAEQRRRIARIFGCDVGELYGQREVPVIACECRHGSLHVEQERVILEIVGPRGERLAPGETGEIVVTLLHSHEMPLIRYRSGDVGTLLEGRCPCGLSLERLDLGIGRLEDTVMRSDGRLVQSRFVRGVYEERLGSELVAHRTTQTGPAEFSVTLELRGEPPDGLAAVLAESFSAYLDEPVEVDLTIAELEPQPPGRKRRTFTRNWRL